MVIAVQRKMKRNLADMQLPHIVITGHGKWHGHCGDDTVKGPDCSCDATPGRKHGE
eukprot:CAMPEP_0118893354 /NCGR_PEP_ID=MMETSP1166-20130328/2598_1 /TAXON_ID=1104430 /ORGANISM="Chrysoreinhardia sp, Strain CCMP3193" /LENGTH=55 /DNA_ID=CAMNT_0006832161 /DNA_START=544 /DNA_END=711 /DNA_ORIENTATION=+